MNSAFISTPRIVRYRNKLFKKWIVYWKTFYADYAQVGVTAYQDCVAKPTRSCLIFGAVWGIYYMKSCNPNEMSYRSAVVETNNRFIFVSSLIRNPLAVDHLEMIDKSFSQGLVRRLNCGLFSIIWLDDYDDAVSLYKRNCRYLSTSWVKIVDVGFMNHWWILDHKMIDCDVDLREFEKQVKQKFPNPESPDH